MTKNFLVVFETGPTNYSAFAPDIQGCYAVGETLSIVRERFCEAAQAHLEWMFADGDPIPEPATTSFTPSEDDGDPSHYSEEWLAIPLPANKPHTLTAA